MKTTGRLYVRPNQKGGFDFDGDRSLVDVSPSGEKFTLAYKRSLWFAPQYTLTNASAPDFEWKNDALCEVRYFEGVMFDFAHWWHRPIWWAYTRWAGLKERFGK